MLRDYRWQSSTLTNLLEAYIRPHVPCASTWSFTMAIQTAWSPNFGLQNVYPNTIWCSFFRSSKVALVNSQVCSPTFGEIRREVLFWEKFWVQTQSAMLTEGLPELAIKQLALILRSASRQPRRTKSENAKEARSRIFIYLNKWSNRRNIKTYFKVTLKVLRILENDREL